MVDFIKLFHPLYQKHLFYFFWTHPHNIHIIINTFLIKSAVTIFYFLYLHVFCANSGILVSFNDMQFQEFLTKRPPKKNYFSFLCPYTHKIDFISFFAGKGFIKGFCIIFLLISFFNHNRSL